MHVRHHTGHRDKAFQNEEHHGQWPGGQSAQPRVLQALLEGGQGHSHPRESSFDIESKCYEEQEQFGGGVKLAAKWESGVAQGQPELLIWLQTLEHEQVKFLFKQIGHRQQQLHLDIINNPKWEQDGPEWHLAEIDLATAIEYQGYFIEQSPS